jgi:ferritin
MSFEQQIQQWVAIDNQMKVYSDKMKELRDKKHELTDKINTYVETSQITNSTVKINDGQLKFIKVKDTQHLTFKYLETCLKEIIKSEEQVEKIIDHIKNKREIKYIPEIKRFYNN